MGTKPNMSFQAFDIAKLQKSIQQALNLSEQAERKPTSDPGTAHLPENKRGCARVFTLDRGLRFEGIPTELIWRILDDVPFDRAIDSITDDPSQYNISLRGYPNFCEYLRGVGSHEELVRLRDVFRFMWRTTILLSTPTDLPFAEQRELWSCWFKELKHSSQWNIDRLLPRRFHKILLSSRLITNPLAAHLRAQPVTSEAQIRNVFAPDFYNLRHFLNEQVPDDEIVWASHSNTFHGLRGYLCDEISKLLLCHLEVVDSAVDVQAEDFERYKGSVLKVVSSESFQTEAAKKIAVVLGFFDNCIRPNGKLGKIYDQILPQRWHTEGDALLQSRRKEYVQNEKENVKVRLVRMRPSPYGNPLADRIGTLHRGKEVDASYINIEFQRTDAMLIETIYEGTRTALGRWYEHRARELFRGLCAGSLSGIAGYLAAHHVNWCPSPRWSSDPDRLQMRRNHEKDTNWGSFDILTQAQQTYWWQRLQHGVCRIKFQQIFRLADIMEEFPHMTMLKGGLDNAPAARANYAHITNRMRIMASKVKNCKIENSVVRFKPAGLFRFYGLPVHVPDRDLKFFLDSLARHPPDTILLRSSSENFGIDGGTGQHTVPEHDVHEANTLIETACQRLVQKTGFHMDLNDEKYTYSGGVAALVVTALNGLTEIFRKGIFESLSRVELDEDRQLKFKPASATIVPRPRIFANKDVLADITHAKALTWCDPLDDRDIDWLESFLKAVVWMRQTWAPTEVIQPVIKRGHSEPCLVSEDTLRHGAQEPGTSKA